MTDIFTVAIKKAGVLPPAVRDNFGYELIDRVAAWNELKKKIAAGMADVDAGRVSKLPTVEAIIQEAKKRHANNQK